MELCRKSGILPLYSEPDQGLCYISWGKLFTGSFLWSSLMFISSSTTLLVCLHPSSPWSSLPVRNEISNFRDAKRQKGSGVKSSRTSPFNLQKTRPSNSRQSWTENLEGGKTEKRPICSSTNFSNYIFKPPLFIFRKSGIHVFPSRTWDFFCLPDATKPKALAKLRACRRGCQE